MLHLMVLYPQPSDAGQFEKDYTAHVALLHEKTGIPTGVKPYTITKFLQGPDGKPPFYQQFSMPFESREALEEALASPGMQAVATDAARISSGGSPVVMIGMQDQ